LCKEVGRDVKLEGGSFFQRTEAGGGLLYVVGTYPDGVFWKTSAASAHVKILEVPKEFANTECPSLESAFATVVEQGPTYGWYKTERYLAYKNPSGEGESRTVDVKAPEGTDDVYCTHKFVLGSRIGDTSYGLLSWTPTKMVMSVRAKTVPGGPGAHINLTLYVRYLPREDREKFADKFGCTANFPPQYSDPQNNFQQPSQRDFPDGSSMFVVP
jgi:hypothetical protein